jgi:hypothetical protein
LMAIATPLYLAQLSWLKRLSWINICEQQPIRFR